MVQPGELIEDRFEGDDYESGGCEQVSNRFRSFAGGHVSRQTSAGPCCADGLATEPLPPRKKDVVVVDFTNNAKQI